MKQFCLNAINLLNSANIKDWAVLFVNLRMEFARTYQKELITSTYHGIDFFQNVLDCLNGKKWLEPGEPEIKSIYGENFRKLISNELKKIN